MKKRRGEREEERKKQRVEDMINHQLYFEEPMSVPVILFRLHVVTVVGV